MKTFVRPGRSSASRFTWSSKKGVSPQLLDRIGSLSLQFVGDKTEEVQGVIQFGTWHSVHRFDYFLQRTEAAAGYMPVQIAEVTASSRGVVKVDRPVQHRVPSGDGSKCEHSCGARTKKTPRALRTISQSSSNIGGPYGFAVRWLAPVIGGRNEKAMRVKTWSLMTLFLILLGLAVYVALVVRRTAGEPWRDVSIAGYVAIGCGVASILALAIGALLLHRQRRDVPRGAAPLSQKAASPVQSRKSWLARLSERARPAARGDREGSQGATRSRQPATKERILAGPEAKQRGRP